MRSYLVHIYLFCALFVSSYGDAASFHLILVGDTEAKELKDSILIDMLAIKEEMSTAALHCDLDLKAYSLSGEDATPKRVIETVSNLEIMSEDLVFFYFSGHGYRVPSKLDNPWPNLAFTKHYQGVDLVEILEILREKSPRFLIAVADCCNNVIPDLLAPLLISRQFSIRGAKPYIKQNYLNLFLHSSGEMIVSASKPGLFAWSTSSGGLYTIAFLSSLQTEIKKKKVRASWQNVLDRAAYIIRDNQVPEYLFKN